MGEKLFFQPLTTGDKVPAVLYRIGIALATFLICLGGGLFIRYYGYEDWHTIKGIVTGKGIALYILALHFSVGLSVFTIHLYVKRLSRFIKGLYLFSVFLLIFALFYGKGDVGPVLFEIVCGPLFLFPLSGCIGVITAKEAFCLRLNESFLLAILMPYIYCYLLIKSFHSERYGFFTFAYSRHTGLFCNKKGAYAITSTI